MRERKINTHLTVSTNFGQPNSREARVISTVELRVINSAAFLVNSAELEL